MASEGYVAANRWWRPEVLTEEFLEMTGAIVFYALTEILGGLARGEDNHAAAA